MGRWRTGRSPDRSTDASACQDRGRSSERGAAVIEAAIVTPVFFLFIFGLFEFGLLFRDSLTTDNASHQGARAASVGGGRADADYLIIRSVEHGMQAMDLQQLDYIVVFKADGPDDEVPVPCLSASQTYDPANPTAPACNRYTAVDFFAELDDPVTGQDTGNFRCGVSSVDRFWCPADRITSLSAGTDYVGIHVQTQHDFITGMFGSGRGLSETSIIRLEPDVN
jgi:hypothetical protein